MMQTKSRLEKLESYRKAGTVIIFDYIALSWAK